MRKLSNLLILLIFLEFLFVKKSYAFPFNVFLYSSYGNPINGAKVYYAPGGTWYFLGHTGDNGPGKVQGDVSEKENVKIKIIYNKGYQIRVQNIKNNPNFMFYTQEATIRLIDHRGRGLQNGEIWQGGTYPWVKHGYTDKNGNFYLQMFPGIYKFRMKYNYTSQILWGDIDSPIIFQTGLVNGPTAIQYASGSWITFRNPMELLPGSYKFKFNDGSIKKFEVLAGQILNIPSGTYGIIPEPSTLILLSSGLFGIGIWGIWGKKRK